MCGIAGQFGSRLSRDSIQAQLTNMMNSVRHRGPDDSGMWVDADAQIALGHRRLSIIDLSAAGHQPMISASGRYVIVFNGEIYNHLLLREEVEKSYRGNRWKGHSDTEVLLAAIELWGVAFTLPKLTGMFAFAVWDRQERQLILARDRMGEKPLYYSWQNETFLFGSELKALRAHVAFRSAIDRDSLALFFRYSYIPAPYTVYENVWKLPPATYLEIVPGQSKAEPKPYWSIDQQRLESIESFWSDQDAIAGLDGLLNEVVSKQMISDVPLGAFLSGGVDSSLITAIMCRHASSVRSFSIGFDECAYNEASDAAAVAKHLGTSHTELYVTPSEAMDVIPLLPTMYDEPFGDSSQIVTYLLAQMTRQHVTVALSGDGGDEIFGGYNRHLWVRRIWKQIGWLPSGIRLLVAKAVGLLTPQHWGSLFRLSTALLRSSLRPNRPAEKLQKLVRVLPASSASEVYRILVSHWSEKDSLILGASEPATFFTDALRDPSLAESPEEIMRLDSLTYLPDDILVKVDRAAMAVSLETRIPFLDHRVVGFAGKLPLEFKIRGGVTKWILREVLSKYVPRTLTERPKSGFAVPIDQWLRGPLRGWAESLLDQSVLRQQGLLNSTAIQQKWSEHISGKSDWHHHIWDVLVFQMWLGAQTTSQSYSVEPSLTVTP